jgi:hypothetical protein
MKVGLAARSPDIHWPAPFDPERADLFSHNGLLIGVRCEQVWQHIVDIGSWPRWYPNSTGIHLLNKARVLGLGVRWRWTTFSLAIKSRIDEFVPYSRLGWFGYAPGTAPAFYHTWLLAPHAGGCLVATEEVGLGQDSEHLRQTDQGILHQGHDLWLAGLRRASESP